jgi:hypothetical protein
LIDQTLKAGSETLEELTISNICIDWFWEYQQSNVGAMLQHCKELRRLNVEGGWCQNPLELLKFLRRETTVKEVTIAHMNVEGASWYEVLRDLRMSKTTFNHFDIRASRCPSTYYPALAESAWAAPWYGPSDKVVPWLQGDIIDLPLSQGPG